MTTLSQKIALWSDRLRDISAQGLRWTEGSYDQTRYRTIQDVAMEMYALVSSETLEEIEPLRETVFSHITPFTCGDGAVIDWEGR